MILQAVIRSALGSTVARACTAWLLLIIAGALVGPALGPWADNAMDWDALEAPPSLSHWFGTDLIGRDMFVRVMLGARISLAVAVVATFVSVIIGVPYGAFSGLRGGRIDQLMMRFVDTLYALAGRIEINAEGVETVSQPTHVLLHAKETPPIRRSHFVNAVREQESPVVH